MLQDLKNRGHVIGALILRDMRTRFGSSHSGYLIQALWPLVHLVAITGIFVFVRRTAPIFGSNNFVYIATGVLPYIMMMYPSRMMSLSLMSGKGTLHFPAVKPLDIMISRAIVEVLTAFLVALLYIETALAFGVNLLPSDYSTAAEAVLSTVYFSISLGFLGTICSALSASWMVVLTILLVFAYLLSGIFVPMSSFSREAQAWLSLNPLAHCVEWLRSAYYIGYGSDFISKSYVLWTSTAFLFLGLLGERFLRGKLLK